MLPTTRLKKGFYDPDQPENHKEEGKGTRAREKRLATLFSAQKRT